MNTQASVLFQFDKWIRNLVRNPFRVVCVMHHLPRVAMSTWQPWALLHNAVGVEWLSKDGFERRGGGGDWAWGAGPLATGTIVSAHF